MNPQALRIGGALLLAIASLLGVIILAVVGQGIPELLSVAFLTSSAYLFGVTSNGSGIPKKTDNGDTK